LPPAGQIRRAVYRVELDGDDPSALFPETPQQHVKKLGPNTAEITVTAPSYQAKPDDTPPQPGASGPASDRPTADDSAPNNMIESDDPTIVTLAGDARGEAGDPLAVARALEAYVHHTVKEKNFSQVFASALEVADSHEGDCTEHAVLLTALARALGMPARVVVGLVYVPSQQGFAYHMWSEIYDGKIWLPLDATVGRGSIGAGYLELGTSSLKDASGLAELLSVVQVLGKLKIEVVEAV
jgi:transglutaminase-like putative cysteine protease